MDLITSLRAFVATAQTRSFTAAADRLGISNRLTSKYVAELEARLDTRLFQRTTRRVGLTPAGEDLLARAPALLDDLDNLLSETSEAAQEFSGVLRIAAPLTFGEYYVADMLGRFSDQHPGITFDLRLDDRQVDLATDGIDLAFRIGVSDALTLKLRKLGEMKALFVAAPSYLETKDRPKRPEDLLDHTCIIDTNRRNPRHWVMAQGEQTFGIDVKGTYAVNSARAARALAVSGKGICYLPLFAIQDDIQNGTLVPLLTDYETELNPITLAFLEGRTLTRKVRALMEFAAEDIKTMGF